MFFVCRLYVDGESGIQHGGDGAAAVNGSREKTSAARRRGMGQEEWHAGARKGAPSR